MLCPRCSLFSSFFFFNDTATTEIYTLSLHDALPISPDRSHESTASAWSAARGGDPSRQPGPLGVKDRDRKSTRLNSSHQIISYAVFCLKKKTIYHSPARHHLRTLLDTPQPAFRAP